MFADNGLRAVRGYLHRLLVGIWWELLKKLAVRILCRPFYRNNQIVLIDPNWAPKEPVLISSANWDII